MSDRTILTVCAWCPPDGRFTILNPKDFAGESLVLHFSYDGKLDAAYLLGTTVTTPATILKISDGICALCKATHFPETKRHESNQTR